MGKRETVAFSRTLSSYRVAPFRCAGTAGCGVGCFRVARKRVIVDFQVLIKPVLTRVQHRVLPRSVVNPLRSFFEFILLVLDEFVEGYFLVAKSKLESSPTVWQDVREGYIRSYGIYFTDQLLDSLKNGQLSSYHAGIRHFPAIEDLRLEAKSGKVFEYVIEPTRVPTFNINYFSSVID